MELCYDGLGGKIIDWTMKHGSKKADGSPQDHPSLLAFLVGRDGEPFALLSNNQQYQAASLAKWALEQLDAYERAHPSTRLAFVPGRVTIDTDGSDETPVCAALEEARAAKRPLLLYFGRGHFDPADKATKKENKRARKFEKGTLNSKTAAKETDGWVLLRYDLSDEAHAKLAARLGVKAAPELLLWPADAEQPVPLGGKVSGHALAFQLKKHRAPAAERAEAK